MGSPDYVYISDLKILDSRQPSKCVVSPLLQGITTPLQSTEWREALSGHPIRHMSATCCGACEKVLEWDLTIAHAHALVQIRICSQVLLTVR